MALGFVALGALLRVAVAEAPAVTRDSTHVGCSARTCADLGWSSFGSPGVCVELDASPLAGCSELMNWVAAHDACESVGGRLCTAHELTAARGAGCGSHGEWSRTACGEDAFVARRDAGEECAASGELYFARCCADEACGRRLTSSDVSTFAELQSAVSSADSGSSIPVRASMTFTERIYIGTSSGGTTYSATPITITGATCTEVLDGGGSTPFFVVYSGATLNLECLTLQNGYTGVSGLSLRARYGQV